MVHFLRWGSQLSLYHIHPGAFYRKHGAEDPISFSDVVLYAPAGIILSAFDGLQVDLDGIAQADLLSENALLPEQDGPNMQLTQRIACQAELVEELDAAKGPPVVIHRMAEVKIRIQVGPAHLYILAIDFHYSAVECGIK